MISALRRRLSREDGVSLVEVLAALMIVGVVLMALTSTTLSSMAAAGGNERQSRASQVGNELLETMQGLPFSEVTFYSGDFPPPTTAPPGTVQIGGSRPAGARMPLPADSTTVDGTTYQRETKVQWGDDPADGSCPSLSPCVADADPTDYKLLSVVVRWQVGTQTRTLRLDGRRSHLNAAGAVSPFKLTSFFLTPADAATNPIAMDQLLSTTACTTSPASYRLRVAVGITVTVNRPASSAELTITDPAGVYPASTWALTSSDGGLTWAGSIPQNTCMSEGTKTLAYRAQTSASPPEVKEQQESLWFGRQEEQFVTIANYAPVQPTIRSTNHPQHKISRCQTVVNFDVRGVSATSIPTVRFTWASGFYGDTVVATHSASSGSATNSTYGSVSYTYTTTAPGVRSYVATVAAGVGVDGIAMNLTARAHVPTGDFDEESRSIPVQPVTTATC